MAIDFCVLGSGSGGNSTVVRAAQGCFLVDAGFGPRVTEQRLYGTEVALEHLQAIVLTHLDHDHFNPNWLRTIARLGIRIFCDRRKVKGILQSAEMRDFAMRDAAGARRVADLVIGFDGTFEVIAGVKAEPCELAHDSTGSHGFVLTCEGYKVGYATDLGHVPEELIERFSEVDALLMESNYDPEMQERSSRPYFLKKRIMGGSGHLSNEQAMAAVRAILDRAMARRGMAHLPRHIVLMHRSRECNCPDLLERIFCEDERVRRVLTLAHQHERTGWLSVRREKAWAGEQAELFGG